MQQFIKHFRREEEGVWVCVAPATLDLPQGRVQVTAGSRFITGTMFMNVELAALLWKRITGRIPAASRIPLSPVVTAFDQFGASMASENRRT